MTIETFVRTSGNLMGIVRESFGPGGQLPLTPASIGPPPLGPSSVAGSAADGAAVDSSHVHTATAALGEHDQTSRQTLTDAAVAAGEGRGRMDRIIAAALADVGDADISTPDGKRELIKAITRHLEETKTTLDGAQADASTRAAAARATAGGYNAVATTSP